MWDDCSSAFERAISSSSLGVMRVERFRSMSKFGLEGETVSDGLKLNVSEVEEEEDDDDGDIISGRRVWCSGEGMCRLSSDASSTVCSGSAFLPR